MILSFRTKLVVFFLLISVLPLTLAAWLTVARVDEALLNAIEDQLVSALQIKRVHVEQYAAAMEKQLQEMASRNTVKQAMAELKAAFPTRTDPSPDQITSWRHRVRASFETSFVPEYRRRHKERMPSDQFLALMDPQSLWWQERLVEGNGSFGVTAYDQAHARFHPALNRMLTFHDMADLLLVDDVTGRVIYSARKKLDFATSLTQGPFRSSGLAQAVQQVLQNGDDRLVRVDYRPYFPFHDQPAAFWAVPVLEGGQRIGVLVAHLHHQGLDRIMQDKRGLGQTESLFLVAWDGQEATYRSSRQGGTIGDMVPGLVRDKFLSRADSQHWLANEENALQAMVPLTIAGLDWRVTGILPLDEAMAPARNLDRLLWLLQGGMLAAAVAAGFLFSRSLLQPMRQLAQASQSIAQGSWSSRVTMPGRDEVAATADAFNHMAERVEQQYWVKEKLAQLAGLFQSARNVETLGQALVRELLALLEAAQGACYVLQQDAGRYVLVGHYAFLPGSARAFGPGEGLVGRCAMEARAVLLEGAAVEGFSLDTGLGQAPPLTLLALPMLYHQQVVAVVVLAAWHPFTPVQRQLLDELAILGGLSLDNLARVRHIEELLEESRRQAVELEAQTQILRLSEDELRAQKMELEQANQQLEEQSQLLESRHAQLEEASQALERASRTKSEFLANMSHELRTPLNSILILAREFMKNEDGRLDPGQVEASRVMFQSGSELLEMINEILDISRIEAGRVEHHVEEMSPALLADELRQQFAPLARDKGLAWQVILAEGLPASFSLDLGKVRRIVKNLLANAFKFTRRGSVTVHLENRTGATAGLVIRVVDTGIGIAPSDQEAIFEPFRQITPPEGGKQGGVGLGLAISRKLAGLMAGEIRLTSQPGQGSTFTLVVPAAAHEGELPPVSTEPCLLIIEDDPIFARHVSTLASGRGLRPLVAGTGRAGLELARRHQPRGIILDLGLPDMPGEEVLTRLREDRHTCRLPVHIVSARQDPGHYPGAVGFLAKPVEEAAIQQMLARFGGSDTPHGRQLLLVEDQPVVRKAVADLLQLQGVTVVEAATGEEALTRLAQEAFDGMILDLGLPDLDGFQVLARVADNPALTLPPVVVYSARELTRDEYARLHRYTDTIIVKGHHAEERLRDEVVLFLHRVGGHLAAPTAPAKHRLEVLAGRTVLLVDDDVRNLFAMTRSLEKKGLKVLMAGHGAEALALLERGEKVDLVLMDIMMPVMDGYAAMRAIRRQPAWQTLPIIALTAKAMAEDQRQCLDAGANDYLAKPVDMDRLHEIMRIWLGSLSP